VDAKEYRKAVKQARQVFVYVKIAATRRQAMKASKVKALGLISQVGDGDVNATWADDDHRFLLVG